MRPPSPLLFWGYFFREFPEQPGGWVDEVDDDSVRDEGDGEPLCKQRDAQQQLPCNPLLISAQDFCNVLRFIYFLFILFCIYYPM